MGWCFWMKHVEGRDVTTALAQAGLAVMSCIPAWRLIGMQAEVMNFFAGR